MPEDFLVGMESPGLCVSSCFAQGPACVRVGHLLQSSHEAVVQPGESSISFFDADSPRHSEVTRDQVYVLTAPHPSPLPKGEGGNDLKEEWRVVA